jgi:acetoin utilization deacetylase AcuC-like enzyme
MSQSNQALSHGNWHETLYPLLAGARPVIPVYFTDRMVAPPQKDSPSASKPRAVVEAWRHLNLPLRFVEPEPVTRDDLCLAHDPAYVDGVLNCKHRNGFGNTDPGVAASLPFTTGAMVAAAKEAVRSGMVAVAPVSGFHHANFARARGFCTFNGLVVAAQMLKRDGVAGKVGILDCDHHEGDGTDDLVLRHGLTWVTHITMGKHFCLPYQAKNFFHMLPKAMEILSDCDVILYQAGADPHINDPLGGWLTSDQLRKRDRIVFEAAVRLQVPIAWNLAGGYQEPLRKVLRIHDATMLECARVYAGVSVGGAQCRS